MQSLKSLGRTVDLIRFCGRRLLTADAEKSVLVSKVGNITLIGLNRPEKKNCINVAMAEQLCTAFEEFDKDSESNTCVLYGNDGNFCAGYDLEEIANFDGENVGSIPHFSTLANKTELSSKVVVAALSGYTLGVGLELALMCDLRVIEDTAVLGFFNRRFGIPILTGGTVRLPAMIGYSRAIDMILTGRKIQMAEAFQWGLATRATTGGTALGTAVKIAGSVNKFPQRSLLSDRASARFSSFDAKSFEEALQFERDTSSHLLFEEAVNEAKRFVTEDVGKHGKFRISNENFPVRELDKELL